MSDEAWRAAARDHRGGRLRDDQFIGAGDRGGERRRVRRRLRARACCDFIYAATDARFALPEVTRGIMPGAGGTQTLARAVGERRAKEIILTRQAFHRAGGATTGAW